MSFNFFGLARELRDQIYAEVWAATPRRYPIMVLSVHAMAQYAGNEQCYESYLDTAKCFMANKQMLSESLEEFHRSFCTFLECISPTGPAISPNRFSSIGGLLSPLKAKEIRYKPFLLDSRYKDVWTGQDYECLVTHGLCHYDLNFMKALARKLSDSQALHTFKLELTIVEVGHKHQRFLLDEQLACFKSLVDKGCKFEVEVTSLDLDMLTQIYPTAHHGLMVSMEMLQGITLEDSVLSSKYGYYLDESALKAGWKELEDCVVFKWNFTFKKA